MKTGELNPDVIVEILVGDLPYQNPSAEDPSKDQGQVRKEERDLHRDTGLHFALPTVNLPVVREAVANCDLTSPSCGWR